jgi:hypothetical protein
MTGGQVYWRFDDLPCQKDCAGQFGGDAVLDDCGICADGASGHLYNETIDCMEICAGEAEVDICGVCAGGTSGVTPSSPADCPYAPDLIVDQAYLASTLLIEDIQVDDACLIEELCVGGLGQRKVLRFGTRIANIGNSDLQLGTPSEDLPHWHWDDCHGHFHYDEYAVYHLFNLITNEQLPMSAKAGFSVIDIGVYDPELAPNGCVGYNGRNQGISVGCQDTYSRSLRCQWIDITGLANGDYRLEVTTNPIREIDELHYDNNTASVNVRIFDHQVEVIE